jgi:hypothetical protein
VRESSSCKFVPRTCSQSSVASACHTFPGRPIARSARRHSNHPIKEPLGGTDGQAWDHCGRRDLRPVRCGERIADLLHLRGSISIERIQWVRAKRSVICDVGCSIPCDGCDGAKRVPCGLPDKPLTFDRTDNNASDRVETHCLFRRSSSALLYAFHRCVYPQDSQLGQGNP